MMRLACQGGVLIVGLTERDVEQLRVTPVANGLVLVIYGDTMRELIAKLEALEVDIPQAVKDAAREDPF